jgi:hypothetical protein
MARWPKRACRFRLWIRRLDRSAVQKNWLRVSADILAIVCSPSGTPQLKTTIADGIGNQVCAPIVTLIDGAGSSHAKCLRLRDAPSVDTKLSRFSTLPHACVRTLPVVASHPKLLRGAAGTPAWGRRNADGSAQEKRGRMKTLKIAGALSLALMSGIAPSLNCRTDAQGESTCRTTWPDIRYQASPSGEQSTPKGPVKRGRKQNAQ